MATRRHKIARSAIRRVKRRNSKNTKLRTLRSRKNTTEKKARLNMREMRGGGGKYDIYLVYFDDVAKFKDPMDMPWQEYMSNSISDENSSPLVGVLFYNPTDKKFYFFGYNKFYRPYVCRLLVGAQSSFRADAERTNDDINRTYREMILVKLVQSLLACTAANKPSELWMRMLNWDNKRDIHPGNTPAIARFNCYLTFSDGKLKYTRKKLDSEWGGDYVSELLYTCTDDRPLSLPSTMLSSLIAVPTTLSENPAKTIECTNTKRAYLFFQLPDTYKEKYDPTTGMTKTDSKPLETVYRLINDIGKATDLTLSPDSTPVLEYTWLDRFPLKKETITPDL